MKKIILWFIPFMLSVNLYAQNSANEPTLQETLDWLSSKCTTSMGIYNDKPGVWSEDYEIYFQYNLDKKEINYCSRQRIYFNNKAQEVHYNDIFLRIHFEDLSGCQITPNTDRFGMHYVELKLASHNKCKMKWMQTENAKDELKFTVNLDYEPDTDCSRVEIKLFYRENLISSDRIIKALQHLIILTGGTLEPF
jgi:hypothetical protein